MYFFISLSNKDQRTAKDIELYLRNNGIEYFLYTQNIKPGRHIVDEVIQALSKVTHLVVIISKATLESAWVWYEVGIASGLGLAKGKTINIIPFVIDTDIDLPDFVRNLKYIQSIYELDEYIREEREHPSDDVLSESMTRGGYFDFYGFSTSIRMVDFCSDGYRPNNINLNLISADDRNPPERYRKLYEDYRRKWEENKNKGYIFDNNDLVGLRSFALQRIGEDEDQSLLLNVFAGSYVDHRATVELFRNLDTRDKNPIIHETLESEILHGGHPFFGTILAISVAIITSDQKIIFHRRSKNVSIDPGLLMCGVGEGMKTMDLDIRRNEPNGIYRTAIRGMVEEFGIKINNPEECLKLTGLCLNRDLFEWYVLGVIDLRKANPKCNEDTIKSVFSSAFGKDRFEIEEMYFVPYYPETVFRFIREHKEEMVNYGLAAAVCSLLADPEYSLEQLRSVALKVLEKS